jgi:branched-chain amino acid transport system permease protein
VEQIIQTLIIGLSDGLIFALVALGYTLVYGIIELINFAHGDLFMIGSLIAFGLLAPTSVGGLGIFPLTAGMPAGQLAIEILATLAITIAATAAINVTIERLAYRPLRHAPKLAPLITAIGMSFVLQNVGLAFAGSYQRTIENVLGSDNLLAAFGITGVTLTAQQLFVGIVTIHTLIALTWLVARTKQGKAMRATAQDPEASAMMGINVNRTISFTFLLAGALAGIGAVLFLVQFNIRYDTGFELGLIAFTAAVLGGIGNLSGAVLGAIIIGMIQAFNEGPFLWAPGSDWTRSIVFGILIAILVFRPEGLLGERTPEGG